MRVELSVFGRELVALTIGEPDVIIQTEECDRPHRGEGFGFLGGSTLITEVAAEDDEE